MGLAARTSSKFSDAQPNNAAITRSRIEKIVADIFPLEPTLSVTEHLTGIRRKERMVKCNLLVFQFLFLSREVSYNNQIAIVGHPRCTDFNRNHRSISSLHCACKAQRLALVKLLQTLLSVVFFCGDIGVRHMKLEQFVFGVPKHGADL